MEQKKWITCTYVFKWNKVIENKKIKILDKSYLITVVLVQIESSLWVTIQWRNQESMIRVEKLKWMTT